MVINLFYFYPFKKLSLKNNPLRDVEKAYFQLPLDAGWGGLLLI